MKLLINNRKVIKNLNLQNINLPMKYDFWMDLPKSLIEVGGDSMTTEDQSMADVIQNSNIKFREMMDKCNLANIEMQKCSKTELLALKQKFSDLHKEKTQLLCQSIKFCTKLMTKILNWVEKLTDVKEDDAVHHLADPVDLLTRIKLFLKITRLVVEHANKELLESNGQQMQFFTMIKVFTEKIQSRLYSISNELIKGLMKNTRKVCEDTTNVEINKETKAM